MIRIASPIATTANLPRFKKGWTDKKTGREKSGFWYLFHEGRKVALTSYGAPQLEGGKVERNLAIVARDAYLASLQAKPETAPASVPNRPTVADVLNYYAANHVPTQAPRTQIYNNRILKIFATGSDSGKKGNGCYKGFGALPADEMTEGHLDDWKRAHPKWGDEKPLGVIKYAFGFAKKKGLIKSDPLVGRRIKKNGSRPLDFIFSDEEETKFKEAIAGNPAFDAFFQASLDLGTRPGELATLTTRHVKEVEGKIYWVLQPEEWKCGRKTRRPRIIALPQKWQDWTREQLETLTPGKHLFRNAWGLPWYGTAWCDCFERARERAGIRSCLTLYAARTTFISRKLKEGIPVAKLARACGTSVQEIERVYDKNYGDFAMMAEVMGA